MPRLIEPVWSSEPFGVQALSQNRDWGLDSLGVDDRIWGKTQGEGVLWVCGDTGYGAHRDGKDPEFVENFSSSRDGIDRAGHGQHVAGTVIAQDNGFGYVGVAPGAGFGVLKLLGDSGSNSTNNIIRGYRWLLNWWANRNEAMRKKYHSCVLSLSLGGPADQATARAIGDLFDAGILVFAAMGNSGRESFEDPGISSIGVAAIDRDDKRARFSTYNRHCDMACPGVGIVSFGFNDSFVAKSGTSMATPYASGCGALVLSSFRDEELRTHDGFIEFVSERSPFDLNRPGKDPFTGWGKPNVDETTIEPLFNFGISAERNGGN